MIQLARRESGRRRAVAPNLECLEGRRLLSGYTGPSFRRVVNSIGRTFLISVSGPGVIKVHPGGGSAVDISAFGTTGASTLSVTQIKPRWHFPSRLLVINKITITSHQLGGLDAAAAELNGVMTPISGTLDTPTAAGGSSGSSSTADAMDSTLNTLELGYIGPNARIDVQGNVGTMSVSQVALGPTGHVIISGRLNTNNLTTSMTVGGFTIDGGRFMIGQDSMAPIAVMGGMTISHDGLFSIGRDSDGAISVSGDLVLDTGGQLFVGRNMSALTVDGNLVVNPSGSGLVVNGQLGSLAVDGVLQGQGGTASPTFFDVGVGLTLNGLTITGATTNQDGLINANIRAGSSISGVNIAYNSVNSTIQPDTPPPT